MHDVLGPGLFESIYNECLQYEFRQDGLSFAANVQAPVIYKGLRLKSKFYLDLVVEGVEVLIDEEHPAIRLNGDSAAIAEAIRQALAGLVGT